MELLRNLCQDKFTLALLEGTGVPITPKQTVLTHVEQKEIWRTELNRRNQYHKLRGQNTKKYRVSPPSSATNYHVPLPSSSTTNYHVPPPSSATNYHVPLPSSSTTSYHVPPPSSATVSTSGTQGSILTGLPKQNNSMRDYDGDIVLSQDELKLWQDIQDTCVDPPPIKPIPSSQRDWATVRIFVSSTFSDFHSEREVLVKRVFPELRQWCMDQKLHLVECDLRWGIPKDTPSGETLKLCLEEVDQCASSSPPPHHPFFLNLLSLRYGWVPDLSFVPPTVRWHYQWIDGFSVTAMEIMLGAYRKGNPNAAFFCRESGFLSGIPDPFREDFLDGAENIRKISILKKKIRERFPKSFFKYNCNYAGIDENGKPKMNNLEDFQRKVLEFFKEAISRQYPTDSKPVDPIEIARAPHILFLDSRSQLVLGFDNVLAEIQAVLKLPQGSKILLQGPSGVGKTTLLAKIAKTLSQKSGWKVFVHFVGATPHSTDVREVLKRINWEMGVKVEEVAEVESLAASLAYAIRKLEKEKKKVAIFIDQIEQLQTDRGNLLWWLPATLPSNVKFIISYGYEGEKKLQSNLVWDLVHEVQGLDLPSCTQLIKANLSPYSKTLDPEQLQLLLSNPAIQNPLFLTTLCEELRIFGIFEKVTSLIQRFPKNLHDLLALVIKRHELEFGINKISTLCCAVALSKNGLLENEILEILNLSSVVEWTPIQRSLRNFLLPSVLSSKVNFYHESFHQAVIKYYHLQGEIKGLRANKLVKYFSLGKDLRRRAEELPYLLEAVGLKQELATCLEEWSVFDFWYNDVNKYEFYRFWRVTGKVPQYNATLESMVGVSPEELGYRYFRVGEFLYHISNYNDALPLVEKSVKIVESIKFGTNSIMGYALNCLAKIYEFKGQPSLELYKMALNVRRRTLGHDHILVANSLNNVAVYYQLNNRVWDALPIFEESLKIVTKEFGHDHPEVADILNNMAQCYETLKKFEEAEKIYNESLNIRIFLQGEFHPKIAATYTNLGNLKKAEEKYEEAKKFYLKGHEINLSVYGENHPTVAADYENMAAMYITKGDLKEALNYFQKCLVIREQLLGETHCETTRVKQNVRELDEQVKNLQTQHLKPNYTRNLSQHNTIDSSALSHMGRTFGAALVHRKCF